MDVSVLHVSMNTGCLSNEVSPQKRPMEMSLMFSMDTIRESSNRTGEMQEMPGEERKIMKPAGRCQNCLTYPATEVWSPEGTIAAFHGLYQYWCKKCVLTKQLTHARKIAANIPQLEKELKNLDIEPIL